MTHRNLFAFTILSTSALALLVFSCSRNRENAEETILISPFQKNINSRWKLVSPDPGTSCELWLSFLENGNINLSYKGVILEGAYEIDSVLNNYIRINIFEKQGLDSMCAVNPQYLSLYDNNTEFSWSRIDDHLYFQKSEKVLKFEKIPE